MSNYIMTKMKNEQARKVEVRDTVKVGDQEIRQAIYDAQVPVVVDKKRRPDNQRKKRRSECDSQVTQEDMEKIKLMTPVQLAQFNGRAKVYRFVYSLMELVLATSNIQGQQNSIVRIIFYMLTGQCIYRCFEIIELLKSSPPVEVFLYSVLSVSNMVFVVQFMLWTSFNGISFEVK